MAREDDGSIIFMGVQALLDKQFYSAPEFLIYWKELISGVYGKVDVWIGEVDETPCAYIVANYFSIPRYLGFGLELEEVVVFDYYRRKGIGRLFLEYLIDHYKKMPRCRKVLIKTDDYSGSGKLYASVLGNSNMRCYEKYLNKI